MHVDDYMFTGRALWHFIGDDAREGASIRWGPGRPSRAGKIVARMMGGNGLLCGAVPLAIASTAGLVSTRPIQEEDGYEMFVAGSSGPSAGWRLNDSAASRIALG